MKKIKRMEWEAVVWRRTCVWTSNGEYWMNWNGREFGKEAGHVADRVVVVVGEKGGIVQWKLKRMRRKRRVAKAQVDRMMIRIFGTNKTACYVRFVSRSNSNGNTVFFLFGTAGTSRGTRLLRERSEEEEKYKQRSVPEWTFIGTDESDGVRNECRRRTAVGDRYQI